MKNADIEEALDGLPDKAADALLDWRLASVKKEHVFATMFLEAKTKLSKSDEWTKVWVRADKGYYELGQAEAQAEALFWRLNERLLACKKISTIRTAF